MSSTTDTAGPRGQVLVIFALSVTVLVLFAALAFDTGMMLVNRRDQQNAADSAALAGAFYLPDSSGAAATAARNMATKNGYTAGGDVVVTVRIPPTSGPRAGQGGAIEVAIRSTRPSIFAGIMGVINWDIGARAVAVNQSGIGAGFAMLALDPTGCQALAVTGQGDVKANGNIQVNSSCADAALFRQGGGTITVTAPNAACNVVGGIKNQGSGALNCEPNAGAPAIPDPLAGLDAPPADPLAPAIIPVVPLTESIPAGCPGATPPPTASNPTLCKFASKYKDTTWRLSPGLYPGGLELLAGTFYFEPGIYYLGGGGLQVSGNGATARSVGTGGTVLGGGVLFYNGQLPGSPIGPIVLNGAQASIDFMPLNNGSAWDGLVIFQDRAYNMNGDDVTINGGSSAMQVRGTIYVPYGDVKVNGSSGTMTVDQVIAWTFKITGNSGTINVLNDQDFVFQFTAAGLVE